MATAPNNFFACYNPFLSGTLTPCQSGFRSSMIEYQTGGLEVIAASELS